MHFLKKPSDDIEVFYATCVSGVGSKDLRTRFTKFTDEIVVASQNYDSKSQRHQLYNFIKNKEINDANLHTVPLVYKKELKLLYEYQVAKDNRPGRYVYNKLLVTKNKKCPFCSVGKVRNLDHFLPKAHFPILAVTPINLVPSCRDCNQDKNDDFSVDIRKQTLHPYFDDVTKVPWLFACIEEESIPPVITYYTDNELVKPKVLAFKVTAHFDAYNLGETFTDLAAEMLIDIYTYCMNLFNNEGAVSLRSYLQEQKESYEESNLNSWQGAMFGALVESGWYCRGEFISTEDRVKPKPKLKLKLKLKLKRKRKPYQK